MATVLSSTAPPAHTASVPVARPRIPTLARVLRTEVLRGSAVLTCVATTVALVYGVFFFHPSWGGSWLGLGVALRSTLESAGPVVLAGAAWAAGRERRRGLGELLGSTARAPWWRVVVGWGAVTLAATLGMAVVWVAAATFVAPVSTFDGGRIWHPLVAIVSVGTIAAVGTAIGTLVPWRGTAPVAAIGAGYMLALMASGQINDGRMWLSPSLPRWREGALDLHVDGAILEVVWFAALAAVLLMVAGARRRVWALAPALLAIAAAVPLLHGPGQDRWPLSADATREVCRGDLPRVCAPQIEAFLLDDVAVRLDEIWPRLAEIEGVPTEFLVVVDVPWTFDREVVLVDVARDLHGRPMSLDNDADLWWNIAAPRCLPPSDGGPEMSPSDELAAQAAAADLLGGSPSSSRTWDPGTEATLERVSPALEALPVDEQRAWLSRYFGAVGPTALCDQAELTALLAVS